MLIVYPEMLHIIIALRVWRKQLQGKPVLIHCNNSVVVSIIQMGWNNDLSLAIVVRNKWLVTTTYNINLTMIYIPGKANVVADVLSRWFIPRTYYIKISQTRNGIMFAMDCA